MMNNDLLSALLSRRSLKPKLLTTPAPGMDELKVCARAALRAPVHGEKFPCRFVLISESQRSHLADLLSQAAADQGADELTQQKAASKAHKGPQIIAFIVTTDPQGDSTETLLSAGAALEQFLLALKALGYGAITLSGSLLKEPRLQAAFCTNTQEKLVAWITVGTPVKTATFEPETGEGPLSLWKDSSLQR